MMVGDKGELFKRSYYISYRRLCQQCPHTQFVDAEEPELYRLEKYTSATKQALFTDEFKKCLYSVLACL